MNKEDIKNFQASFQHIDDILKVLAGELSDQFQDKHMIYDVEWTEKKGDRVIKFDPCNNKEEREIFIRFLIKDALDTLANNFAYPEEATDSWARIKGIMSLRQSPEETQSPISAAEYEEIKVTAEKAKALDLDSVHVNNERPEWTQEQQEALIMKKEEDVIA
jgi:hypothetical protein